MKTRLIHFLTASRAFLAPDGVEGGGAAPAAEPAAAAEAAPTDTPADAGAELTLLGGDPPSSVDDPSPAAGEGEDAPKEDKPAEGDDKPAEADPAKPEDKSGEALDITAITPPEGFEALDAEALAAAEPFIREMGLDTAATQQMVNLAGKVLPGIVEKALAQAQESVAEQHAAMRQDWLKAAQADPEFGGNVEVLGKNIAAAIRFRDRFATPEFVDLLNASGLGDHPEAIRFFTRAGKAYAEDQFHITDPANMPPKSAAETFYGPEFQKKA